MWPESEGLENQLCLQFYFACQQLFQRRAGYYLSTYGWVPHCKAGIHTGKVSAVEIGDITGGQFHAGKEAAALGTMSIWCSNPARKV